MLVLYEMNEYAMYKVDEQLREDFPNLPVASLVGDIKNARRVTISNNVFENNWEGGQPGFAIVFTVRRPSALMHAKRASAFSLVTSSGAFLPGTAAVVITT